MRIFFVVLISFCVHCAHALGIVSGSTSSANYFYACDNLQTDAQCYANPIASSTNFSTMVSAATAYWASAPGTRCLRDSTYSCSASAFTPPSNGIPGRYTVHFVTATGSSYVAFYPLVREKITTVLTCPQGAIKNQQGQCECQLGFKPVSGVCTPYTCPSPESASAHALIGSWTFLPTVPSKAAMLNVKVCAGGCAQAFSATGVVCQNLCYAQGVTKSGPAGYCNTTVTFVASSSEDVTKEQSQVEGSGLPQTNAGNLLGEVKSGECVGEASKTTDGISQLYKYPCSTTTTTTSGTVTTTSTPAGTQTISIEDTTTCTATGSCTSTTTTTVSTGGATSTGTVTGQRQQQSEADKNDICKTNPNRLECATTDVPAHDEKLDKVSKAALYTEVAFSTANVSTCPGGFSFAVAGKTYQVSTQPICDALGYIRVIVLAMAAMIAASIITGGFKV